MLLILVSNTRLFLHFSEDRWKLEGPSVNQKSFIVENLVSALLVGNVVLCDKDNWATEQQFIKFKSSRQLDMGHN